MVNSFLCLLLSALCLHNFQEKKSSALLKKDSGNAWFKNESFAEAEMEYSAGLALCPFCCEKERSILFSNRAAARFRLVRIIIAHNQHEKCIECNTRRTLI